MRKPPDNLILTIQVPPNMKPEDAQRFAQAIIKKHEQEKRDYKIYEQGLRDGSRGLFGLLGL